MYRIISYHIISYHIISYHIISYHIISHIIPYIISYSISYRVMSYHISYRIIYHIIISYHIISYHFKLILRILSHQHTHRVTSVYISQLMGTCKIWRHEKYILIIAKCKNMLPCMNKTVGYNCLEQDQFTSIKIIQADSKPFFGRLHT
jgi:hypothetical protein